MHSARIGEDHTGWTDERVTLRQWLEDQNPCLGETYAVVVEMLYGRWVPGYACFVCHGVREIGNRLPDVVLASGTSPWLDYRVRMEPIAIRWRRAGVPDALMVGVSGAGDPLQSPAPHIPVPRKLVEIIGELVDAHSAVRDENMDRAVRFFEYFMSSERLGSDIIRAKARVWRDTVDWFAKQAHLSLKGSSVIAHNDLLTCFDAFESPLASLSTGFYETLDKLDAILDEANRRSS